MLLTFAEVQFALSRVDEQGLPLAGLPELLGLVSNDPDAVSAAGLASLLIRELARPAGDDAIELVEEVAVIAAALHQADCVHQIAVASTSGVQAWHVVSGPTHRVALSPIGLGVMGVAVLATEDALEVQLAGLITAALDADADADVAAQRVTATGDVVGARTAAELAGATDRAAMIDELLAGLRP